MKNVTWGREVEQCSVVEADRFCESDSEGPKAPLPYFSFTSSSVVRRGGCAWPGQLCLPFVWSLTSGHSVSGPITALLSPSHSFPGLELVIFSPHGGRHLSPNLSGPL